MSSVTPSGEFQPVHHPPQRIAHQHHVDVAIDDGGGMGVTDI